MTSCCEIYLFFTWFVGELRQFRKTPIMVVIGHFLLLGFAVHKILCAALTGTCLKYVSLCHLWFLKMSVPFSTFPYAFWDFAEGFSVSVSDG